MQRGIRSTVCLAFLVVPLASCSPTVKVVRIGETPGDGIFRLVRTKLDVRVADFKAALYEDELGYPRVDFKRFDGGESAAVLKSFDAVVLENKYIRLTLLPGRGKPYSFIYKVTGHEEFFIPTVAQPLGSPNALGWWFALGGVEYTLPDSEHGDTWAAKWEWEVVEDSSARKTVRMMVKELRNGLEETIDISVYPDKAYYQADLEIVNPTVVPVEFQHWINPMWAPGGEGEITLRTEFVVPTRQVYVTERKFNDWMLVYHPERNRLQSYDTSPLRFLTGWKGTGDLLAVELEHGFYSAFSHDRNEGVVRVFPRDRCPGLNIWTWGVDPEPGTRRRFSGSEDCRGYVEMWGGVTRGFDEYHRLGPGQSLSWTEWMYPYTGTGGLHYADKDLALTFTRLPGGEHRLIVCPSGDLKGVEFRVVPAGTDEPRLRVVVDAANPGRKPIDLSTRADSDLELVVIKDGQEVVRLPARTPPEFCGGRCLPCYLR